MINRFFLERFISSFSDGIHISPCGFKESLMDSRIIVVRQTCSISYGFQLVSLLQVDGFRCPIEMINNHVLSKSYLMLDLKIQKGPFVLSPLLFFQILVLVNAALSLVLGLFDPIHIWVISFCIRGISTFLSSW